MRHSKALAIPDHFWGWPSGCIEDSRPRGFAPRGIRFSGDSLHRGFAPQGSGAGKGLRIAWSALWFLHVRYPIAWMLLLGFSRGPDPLPTGDHRFDQVFFLPDQVIENGCDVQANDRQDEFRQKFVPPGEPVTDRIRDQMRQRTRLEKIVRYDKQAGSGLGSQEQHHCDNRQCPKRVVTRRAARVTFANIF